MIFRKSSAGSLPEIRRGHYYGKLSPAQQSGYDAAINAICAFQRKVSIQGIGSEDEMEQILHAIVMEQPQLFYLNSRNVGILQSKDLYAFSFEYRYGKKESEQVMCQIELAAEYILSQTVSDKATDYEKCLAVHDYMTEHVRYAFSALAVNYLHDAYTVEGAILKKQAVCEGIAKGISYLLNLLGIENIIVCGYSDIEEEHVAHAWNMVRLGGDYYHLDATWDLREINHFTNCSHAYVNLDDESMLFSHDWKLEDYPSCSARDQNYYVKEKRYFRTERGFELYVRDFLEEGRTFLDVRFEDTLSFPKDGGAYLADLVGKNASYVGKSYQMASVFHPDQYVFQANITYG